VSNADLLPDLHQANQHLADLPPRPAKANREFEDAACPLEALEELDFDHRRRLAQRIRDAQQACDQITRLIHEAMERLAAIGNEST